ncbi:hypothetical protein CAEBREN_09443 [Caenorhabditis brenneri]|uniref:Uncharacterized protein n=1 Tax=Caenorhabditis brenneri TaxID=135651 RepID=G0NG21_CAEBE|nr:hypothetical protein CAEBREN_09443 [Caenorhabditis brenneri]
MDFNLRKEAGVNSKETVNAPPRVPVFSHTSSSQYNSNLCPKSGIPPLYMTPINAVSMSSYPQSRPQTHNPTTSESYPRFGSENRPSAPSQKFVGYLSSAPSHSRFMSNCIKEPSVENPSSSGKFSRVEKQVSYPHCSEQQPQFFRPQRRFKIIQRPTQVPQSSSVSETEMNNRLIEMIAKEEEAKFEEQMLRKKEEENNRKLENISQCLDSTTLALKSAENVARMQAKEIEMLKKKNNELNKKSEDLTDEAGNIALALYENTRLVDKQNQEITDLKSKLDTLEREKEEWKRKYQSTTKQDAFSIEQIQNSLKTVLINNDMIIENLKGIQKDPEEKQKLMDGHNETHRLLREQERLDVRIRELEEKLKENDDSEFNDFDFCDGTDDSF